MSLNRISLRLVIGAVVLLLGVPAVAQNIRDMQLFARADLSPYGSGPRPREGFFFIFDGLNWSISKPDVAILGFPNLTRLVYYGPEETDTVVQTNTLDTGSLTDSFTEGNRIEFGRVHDRRGWFLSTYRLNNQTQTIAASNVDMVFFDPEFGAAGSKLLEGIVGTIPDPADPTQTINVIRDLPLTFADVFIRNSVEHWSVELMCLHRLRPFHHGGNLEIFAGVRYLEFDEVFDVDARGISEEEATAAAGEGGGNGGGAGNGGAGNGGAGNGGAGNGGGDGGAVAVGQVPRQQAQEEAPADPLLSSILSESVWSTEGENHVIGPQIGARWFKQHSRWLLSVEGRFLAGFNSQNIRQRGTLGTRLPALGEPVPNFAPLLMKTTSFSHVAHLQEFTPVVELRTEAWYHLTRAVSIKAGVTGVWIDNLARPSDMINYQVPTMGLQTGLNRQDALIWGWNAGVVVNR